MTREIPEIYTKFLTFESILMAKQFLREHRHTLNEMERTVQVEKIDPLEIYGSVAGAMGMPQFIPPSYIAYAVKKSSFKEWFSDVESAIMSIGNFLKSHGWQRGLPRAQQKKLLWHYNRSDLYGETVLHIAEKLRK